ncbi:unnamed protein product [Haemonchus placei]|uniref:Uncharacterized protein n=1 Tax=Haemonchus placei TaxID=6290 RepID=A0A0N4XB16_HAEPC|nr:unnamed protein product [Haemonchus placei]
MGKTVGRETPCDVSGGELTNGYPGIQHAIGHIEPALFCKRGPEGNRRLGTLKSVARLQFNFRIIFDGDENDRVVGRRSAKKAHSINEKFHGGYESFEDDECTGRPPVVGDNHLVALDGADPY